MTMTLAILSASTLIALVGAAASAQEPAPQEDPTLRVERYSSGATMLRYHVDEEGKPHGVFEAFVESGARTLLASFDHGQRHGIWKEWRADGRRIRSLTYLHDILHGECEEFHPNGERKSIGQYREGRRHGKWIETDAEGRRKKIAEYRDGLLDGSVRITLGEKVLTRQEWKRGLLVRLDDIEPFPVAKDVLRKDLGAILEAAPAIDPRDPLSAERQSALRRLSAYRRLCGLSFAGMTLDPDWNARCDAAAEICRRIGRLDHSPPKPDGMDEDRYRLGADGASHSNLAIAGSLAGSVDSYMNDSDPSNIDRIGHRRWCLNPAMRKTGFGSDGRFHAMWSMDASGSAPKGMDAVLYPPRGYTPVDLFSADRAFSIAILRGGAPKADELRVFVRPLDSDYLPAGPALPLDHCAVAGPGYGSLACIVFRARGILVAPGSRYLVEVSQDAGKTLSFRYVVEFCEAVRGG